MRFAMAIVGGLIGGLIGAAIWAGISYATNYEIGWIAWGVGFLVGAGVRMGAQEWDGPLPGAIAVIIAVLAVVGGKYATASMLVSKLGAEIPISVTDVDMKETLCREIATERTGKNVPMKWPGDKSLSTARTFADFPADVQQEATKQWDAVPPAEQQQKIAEQKQRMEEVRTMMRGMMHSVAFQASFGVMDILFFLLAAYTAFQLGSGAAAAEGD
jgi:hypothetical protein